MFNILSKGNIKAEGSLLPIAIMIGLLFSLCILKIPWITQTEGFQTIGMLSLLVMLLCWTGLNTYTNYERLYLSIGCIIWWTLIVAGVVMIRTGTTESAAQGDFSNAATGEATVWLACVLLLTVFSVFRPYYLKNLLSPTNKWLLIYTIIVLFSLPFAPVKTYSLAWAVKLIIVVTSLALCIYGIKSIKDIVWFMKFLHIAFLIVTIAPFFQILTDPSVLFKGGRLGGNFFAGPGVSSAAGSLMLLSLILHKYNPGKVFYVSTGFIGFIILFLGFGKTAIVASAVAGISFFLFLRQIKASLTFLISLLLLAGLSVILNLPIVSYISEYQETDQGQNLTGRLVLWENAMPAIMESPFIGHGYLASKSTLIQFKGMLWEPDSLHNIFLEVLYNNGIIGLIPVIFLISTFSRNISSILKKNSREDIAIMASGLFAICIYGLINGMASSVFGGRVTSQTMFFLAAFSLSEQLKIISRS